MVDIDTLHEQASPEDATHLQALQQHFGKQQEAFWKERLTLQQQRKVLQEQRSFLSEYRQGFTEARLLLWKRRQQQLRETDAFDEGTFQKRLENYQQFEDFIRRQQLLYQGLQQEHQQRLAVLHDRRTVLHEFGRDSDHWQQDYQ